MTNLEYYKDEIKRHIKNNTPSLSLKSDVIGDAFRLFAYEKIGLWLNDEWFESQHFIDWLLEEHKESIKLKKWEKDLLEVGYSDKCMFENFGELLAMRDIGYFKGITDITMTVKEILNNCEIIDK